ncbi:MAG: magnesium/cobalt transporter CorA [Candidatus Omnitrophota bacterium]
MVRFIKRISKTAGHIPGELVHVGEKMIDKVGILVIDYDERNFQEKEIANIEEVFPFKDTQTITWINVNGLHDMSLIEKIGSNFQMHTLTLEDIVNTSQRPKYEDLDKYIFVVLKMLMFDEVKKEIISEQVSLIFGDNFVISFQEREGDVFDPIRERIRKDKGRIRKMGADYLAYSLLDAVVDNYFSILEKMGDKIESMEEELITNPTPQTLQAIHNQKQDIIFLRKSVWPLREVVSGLERGESKLIKKGTRIFLRDLYDHTIQAIDTIETFRDMVSGILDIYLSSVSNRMNEIMKVLTIFAAIFIPLTFIAGIYGMNFEYMPELKWKWGYFSLLGLMGVVGFGLLVYFKRKKWI